MIIIVPLFVFFLSGVSTAPTDQPSTPPQPSTTPQPSIPPQPSTTSQPSTTEVEKKNDSYDLSQFDEVYDQRQNGSENYRLNVNKVVLVWTPPGNLLTAAMLLDPALWEPEEADDDFWISSQKPQEVHVIKPETTVAPEVSTERINSTAKATGARRKLRVPGFIRPFLRRQPVIQH